MALLFIDSFDHYNQNRHDDPNGHIGAKWTSYFLVDEILVGQGRCSTNCLRVGPNTDLSKGVPFGSAIGTVGFAANISHAAIPSSEIHICQFYGTDNLPHLRLYHHLPDGSLSVVRTSSPDVVIGRTPPDVVRKEGWYFIEWQAKIDATDGYVIVRVNNVEVLRVEHVKTTGNLTGEMLPNLRAVMFSCGTNEEWKLDDVYILDSTGPAPQNTFLGDCRVEYLRPRAAGTYQQWDLVGDASHWEAVDDLYTPDDDLSYITTVTAGETDTQLYRSTGLPAGPIFGAQISPLARKTDSGPRMLAPVVVQGGTTHIGASQAPSATSYKYLHHLFPVNPITGAPWTVAEINADEYGVKVTE